MMVAAHNSIASAEACFKVVYVICLQAKPENLVDTFILLMPASAKTPNDLARVCELKVGNAACSLCVTSRIKQAAFVHATTPCRTACMLATEALQV